MNQPNEVFWLARPFVSLAQAWRAFWFTPSDPATLGFIRICTGVVLLSVLLASGPLLSSFYAPDGWIDAEASDAMRKDMPWLPPENGWEENEAGWFFDMDVDGDGEVSRKEWTGASPREFDLIDLDKNGRISLEEANKHGRYLVIRPEIVEGSDETRRAADRAWARWGMHPARSLDAGQPFFSHYYHLTTPTQRNLAHVLALLIAVLFTLGVGTRVTSVLAWVTALCYVHRVPVALFGMDTMMGIVLLYLMIGPCGSALSVDRLVTNWWRRRHGLPEAEAAPSSLATVATRLLQIHFCIMYFTAGASKLQGPAWWNGTAIWQTLTNYEFAPRPEAYTAVMRWLTQDRWVWELTHTAAAWGTVALELSLPFLIWRPRWRWLMICASVAMHTGIALTMGLTAFSLFMVCILFAFVPPEAVRGALAWGGRVLARLPRRGTARREEVREPAGV